MKILYLTIMKRTISIMVFMMLVNFGLKAQNYIGMSQTRIVFTFGQPDEKGSNYYVYYDQEEDGSNIYYFDEQKICIVFEMKRSKEYLKDYESMLKKDFQKLPSVDNKYFSKRYNFQAEMTVDAKEFLLKISKCEKVLENCTACLVKN
jgi:hypothetical protein